MSSPARFRVISDETPARPAQALAFTISEAVQRALVARELAELTRRALPWPSDARAEFLVLAAVLRCSGEAMREALDPRWFFDPVHEAIARVASELGMGLSDRSAFAFELGRVLRADKAEVADLLLGLEQAEFSSDEVGRALERVIELAEARRLVVELERHVRALRVETTDTETVRRALRAISEG